MAYPHASARFGKIAVRLSQGRPKVAQEGMAPKSQVAAPAEKITVPPNAKLMITRLKVDQMEKLILKSIVDGAALAMEDVTLMLDGGA